MQSSDSTRFLLDLCHAFASSTDPAEVAVGAVQRARAATGDRGSARLVLLDLEGRLRPVSEAGPATEGGRKRSDRRRQAITSGRPVRLPLRSPSGSTLAMLPLMCRGEPGGVLEVTAPSEDLDAAWEILQAVAAQTAIALRNVRKWDELERTAEAAREAAAPVAEVIRAESAEQAVRAALGWCHRQFGVPVAAWLAAGEDSSTLELLAVRRVGTIPRRALRSCMGSLPRRGASVEDREADLARFAEIAGVGRAYVIDAGRAALMVGTSPVSATRELFDLIGSVLEATLERQAELSRVQRRDDTLDRGIAWTAHEFRGPLAGARAVIDGLVEQGENSQRSIDLLQRSARELGQLSGVVDGLIRWSIGEGSLHRRRVHIGKLLSEIVLSCELEYRDQRIALSETNGLCVMADRAHLRSAVANVLRNALEYSPPGTLVNVDVEPSDGVVTLSIRDRGPGIPEGEREAIFDPFVRGEGISGRGDRGLGLFIARRVVEAHGGRIWVESRGKGATFKIGLPTGGANG